jgi:hypothetical protein
MEYARVGIWPALVAAALTTPTLAQVPPVGDAAHALLACRGIPDETARLRCLDTRAAELQSQLNRGDVVIATRTEVAVAQQAQFGRSPRDLADGRQRPRQQTPPPPKSINISIMSVATTVDGKWVMVLADGARWQQIDSRILARDPKPGMAIGIRRAAMGSFLANVAGQPAMRVRRVN